MTNRATSETVAIAWLLGVTGLTADSNHIGIVLPDRSHNTGTWAWADTGFVQFIAVIGGTPGMYVADRNPVVQVDFWAVNPDSGLPPWGKARDLAELVIADTYEASGFGARDVSSLMPSGYAGAAVRNAYPTTEPRKVPGDAGSFARLTLDLALTWVEL